MGTYILRRLLLFVPTALGITVLVFAAMELAPGASVTTAMAGAEMEGDARKHAQAYYAARYGLNKSPPEQYLMWMGKLSPLKIDQLDANEDGSGGGINIHLAGPDFGTAMAYNQPVGTLIEQRLPVTLLLNLISFSIIYVASILLGVYAARHRGSAFDTGSGVLLLALWSIPVMWAGVMLIFGLASKQQLHWFPTSGMHSGGADSMTFLPSTGADGQLAPGYMLDTLWHLALPVLCLTFNGFAFLAKLTRTAVLENLTADYARTARAKGVSDRGVVWGHVFRNSLLPLITVAATLLPAMLAGSVVVEFIFQIPGMGRLAVEAVQGKDRELVLTITLLAGLLTLVGYLIADVCYAIADPRVSYE